MPGDLLALEDPCATTSPSCATAPKEFGHELGCVIEADEATLERLREALRSYSDE